MTKAKWVFLSAVLTALLAIVGGMAWCADRLPTEDEVWQIVTNERFGPSIGAVYPTETVDTSDPDFEWWINWSESKIVDAYLSDDGKYFFVVYRAPSMTTFTYGYGERNDDVWRMVYGISNNKIVFVGRQMGDMKAESFDFEPWE